MDAAGTTDTGEEVVVHAVLGDPARGNGDETLDPERTVLPDQGWGTLAEEIVVPAANLVPKPRELSWAEAACLPTARLTAYRMLFTRARVRAGQSMLVQGAGGGVATAAIRLAAAAGLRVVVATRSEERGRRALEIGAHEVIRSGDRLDEVDVVVDAVGEATWKQSVAALRPGGTLVTCGASTGFLATTNLSRLFSRQLNLIGSTMGTRAELAALVDLVVARRIEPVVDAVEPLADVRRQFERLVGGDVFGKLVVEA
jgi:NADPH:quinone reductase-like Zn-dependent oxidoreductase